MRVPEGLLYTRAHVWVRQEGDEAVVGLTDYGQNELGDIVYVELPAVGTRLEAGNPLAVVEAVKSVSELAAPVSGEVTAVNTQVAGNPEVVNRDPYGDGWLVRLRPSAGTGGLMSPAEYRSHTGEEG